MPFPAAALQTVDFFVYLMDRLPVRQMACPRRRQMYRTLLLVIDTGDGRWFSIDLPTSQVTMYDSDSEWTQCRTSFETSHWLGLLLRLVFESPKPRNTVFIIMPSIKQRRPAAHRTRILIF